MDASKHTSGVLIGLVHIKHVCVDIPRLLIAIERANADVAQLLRRFENIIAFAPISNHDPRTTAVETFQMEVETAVLVRAAEDILSLTRSLKEAWLFGKLDTIGRGEAETRTEESARSLVVGFRAMTEGNRRKAKEMG